MQAVRRFDILCGVLRGMVLCGQSYKDKDKERTTKMNAEIKIGNWYYRMMGYGGSDSQMCCIRRKTEEKTGAGMFSLFNGTGKMQPLPVSDIYEAVDEKGRTFKVSANDLEENGHIGIGTLREPKYGHVASICREDARLLVETGKYTDVEIMAAFPYAFGEYEDEAEANAGKTEPMTDIQEEILKAAYSANCEKEKKAAEEANRKYAAEVAALRVKYNYIPCPKTEEKTWLSVGDKRRNVLAVLKHEFPGVKFKAHTRNGSTSDSITVEYEDGPAYDKVMKVLNAFETTTYNAYEDIHEDCTQPAACVCGGFDYVFLHRNTSQDVYKFVHDYIMAHVGGATEECARGTAHKVCAKTDFPAGGFELEGLELTKAGEWVLLIKAKAEPSKPTPPNGGGNGDGVTITENTEKNGIEIRFPSMPSENIRNYMKAAGWRWTRYNGGLWYNRATDGNRKMAADIAAMWEKENGKAAA